MLADRTNLAGPGHNAGSPFKKGGGAWTDLDQQKRSATIRDEEEETLRRLKEEQQKIPKLLSKFEEVFGLADERSQYDSTILRKVPPDPKVNISGKALEYLKQETGRLGEGYKKLRMQRDCLQKELEDVQSKYEAVFARGTNMVTKLKREKVESAQKLQDIEVKCLNDRLQAARAKAALGKEAEAVARAEGALEDAKRSLKTAEDKLNQARTREQDALQRATYAETNAKGQVTSLQKARDDFVRMQKERLMVDCKHAELLEVERAKWTQTITVLDQELATLKAKLRDLAAQDDKLQQELEIVRVDNQKKEAHLESLRERAVDAETKLSQKDGNVNLALQTLRQAQESSETRIESLNREKIKLEEKIDELIAQKQGLTERLHESNMSLDRTRDRVDAMSTHLLDVERKVQEAESKWAACSENLEHARVEASSKAAKYAEAKDALERALELFRSEKAKLEEVQLDLNLVKDREEGLEHELAAAKAAYEKIASSPTKMARILQESMEAENLKRKAGDASTYKERVLHLQEELAQAKKLLFEADTQRRALLNEVQNLKGNIRVIARIRPASSKQEQLNDAETSRLVCSVDCMSMTLDLRGNQQRRGATSSGTGSESHSFTFNRVFDKDTTQHTVFEEVSSFVQSALDGYHVCLFSYGQTGSGKTWTMTGDLSNQMNRGIIPRSVDHILGSIAQMRDKGWEYDIECSFMEIYNESIRDLLALDMRKEKDAKHDVLHRGNSIIVTGLRRAKVNEAEEVQALLAQAAANRSVARTDKNAESSRSHSIFTIHLIGRNSDKSGAELVGSLNLCDLAGSERLKVSGATGDRKKETQAINTSLSALATVFTSLSQKAAHIPFRNSTLTDILSPCLSGEGKTLMIVNLSSDHDDAQESLCSLRFAQQVNKTELGKAKKNIRDALPAVSSSVLASNRGRTNSQQ